MQQIIISQPGLKIDFRSGQEGPSYDPYHFDEWTIQRGKGARVLIHEGLAQFLRVEDDRRSIELCADTKGERHACDLVLQNETGCTREEWRKIVALYQRHKERSLARKHRGHDVRSESGYPGEHFTVCHTCGGEVLDSYFNEGAVL